MIRVLASRGARSAASTVQSAEMRFYQLPSGAYPHDVAPAPDGTVWISGQRQGFAGRFDPKTGQLDKIPLGPGAAPHGVIVGPDGNAWLTEAARTPSRASMPSHQSGQAVPAAEGVLPRQSQHARLRQIRHRLVHRPERRLRSGRPKTREGRRLGSAARLAAPTASPRRRRARSGTHRSPATISPMSTPRPSTRPWSILHARASVRAASGRIPRACCGRASGTAAAIGRYDPAAKTWTHLSDAAEQVRHLLRSMSTTRIGFGRPIGSPMPSNASTRRPRPTAPSRATREARTCARCSAGRGRRGAASSEPTGWW